MLFTTNAPNKISIKIKKPNGLFTWQAKEKGVKKAPLCLYAFSFLNINLYPWRFRIMGMLSCWLEQQSQIHKIRNEVKLIDYSVASQPLYFLVQGKALQGIPKQLYIEWAAASLTQQQKLNQSAFIDLYQHLILCKI